MSHAIDRKAFGDTVFLGAAVPIWGLATPANKEWYVDGLPRFDYDPGRARALLNTLGLSDRNGDGKLDDAGQACRFTLLTHKGNTALERGAAFIRDELAKVGVAVDVVALEVGSLVERLTKGDYEAIYCRMLMSDTDPAMNLDFWLSSGGTHAWHPDQKKPASDPRRVAGLTVAAAAPDVAPPRPRRGGRRMAVGFGFPDTVASWGTMLQEASNVSAVADFPWVLVPALAIFVVTLSVNLIVQPRDTISQEASLRTGASHRGLSRATLPD